VDVLPDWDDGTVAVLSTGAGPPHAIPVSTAVRLGPRTIVLALARRRESLTRLRADPEVALTFLARAVACTAYARATVTQDPLPGAERVAAVRLDVHTLQDHRQPGFAMDDAVRWHWTDPEAEARDGEVRALLRRTAGG